MSDSIIRSLGAGSGIDTKSLVTGLVAAERAPKESSLNTKQEKLEAQISAYGTLKSSLSELQNVLGPLSDNDTYNARSVAFPDSDAITPNSVDPGAQTGTYQIEVVDVAQSQSLATGAYADKDAALNETGALTISFGSWAYVADDTHTIPSVDADTNPDPNVFTPNADRAVLNITVEAGDSLEDLADKINAEDAGVQASVLLVDGQYQLLLTAPSGEDNALRIKKSDTATEGLSAFEFHEDNHTQVTETQQAKDAELKINGLTVYRETNEIDDVIQGFNFSLDKADPGNSFTFTVSEDTDIAEQAVRDFVEAYNLFYETAKNLTGFSKDEDNQTVRGDLATDGTAKAIIGQVRSRIGGLVPGIDDGFTALTNVGIRTDLDGTLSIDEDDFSSAMDNNFDLVETLFATKTSSSNSQVSVKEGSYGSGIVAGDYEVVVTANPEKAVVTANAEALVFAPDVTLGSDYAFKITVDGVLSEEIVLSGTYSSEEDVRADLQSLINGDTNIKEANIAVDVDYTGGAFVFTSRSYGASSEVSFAAADLGISAGDLGLVAATDKGVDVAGTIAGNAAFGSGNILLPPIDTDAYGLNFTIGENAVAVGAVTTNYSRGFGGELEKLIDTFLSSSGSIKLREENMNDSLDDVQEDRNELDRKMDVYQEMLFSKYQAMEAILNSFKSTGSQLDGLVDRLPLTAPK